MGWTYGINITGYSGRAALIVASASLALIILLLWFASIRSPDPVSSNNSRSLANCAAVQLGDCDETALHVRPFVHPNLSTARSSIGEQEAEGREYPDIPAFGDYRQALTVQESEARGSLGLPTFRISGQVDAVQGAEANTIGITSSSDSDGLVYW